MFYKKLAAWGTHTRVTHSKPAGLRVLKLKVGYKIFESEVDVEIGLGWTDVGNSDPYTQVSGDKERLDYYRKLEGFIAATIKPHLLAMQASEGGLPDHLQKVRPCPSPGSNHGLGNFIIELGAKVTFVREHIVASLMTRCRQVCAWHLSARADTCVSKPSVPFKSLPRKLAKF